MLLIDKTNLTPIILSLTISTTIIYAVIQPQQPQTASCDRSRRILGQTSTWGTFSSGPIGSNYTQDSHCEWLIRINSTLCPHCRYITLTFKSMATECSYDYVFVYDGDSYNRAPLLGSFSGRTEPQQVIASSGYMLVLLYSDTNYVLDGFRAEYSVTECRGNCTGRGICHEGRCVCDNEWGGADCGRALCPSGGCGANEGRGRCSTLSSAGVTVAPLSRCLCSTGYSGQGCTLYDFDPVGNKWHSLSSTDLQPRAAHTAVYLPATDALYVFGGYDLNSVLGELEVYHFRNSSWTDQWGAPLPSSDDRGSAAPSTLDPASVARLIARAGPYWEQRWGITTREQSFLRNVFYAISGNSSAANNRKQRRHSKLNDDTQDDDDEEDKDKEKTGPAPRYGQAACEIHFSHHHNSATSSHFVMYGGKLDDGTLSSDLWLYRAKEQRWEQRGLHSIYRPPALTRHTLTYTTGGVIYLFGGSNADGDFSDGLYRIRLEEEPSADEQWTEVAPRGGKRLDHRLIAHTTIYHAASDALLVYGGISAGVARFSKLSDRMFAFHLHQHHWTEVQYTREYLRTDRSVPSERAFHTANVMGNYLVVFGGYSHRHNKEEICYDNQMYLYHLGCHTWVNPDLLGKQNDSLYPKRQGVFAHAASVRHGNTVLLVGGYHGNVNGDLLAYTVPPMVAARTGDHYDPEAACGRHRVYTACTADPECGWCSADDLCYGRTVGANCTTNLQTTRCPGICAALGDCHSCLIHGSGQNEQQHRETQRSSQSTSGSHKATSAAQKLGLGECTWCVQNGRCHHRSDNNYPVCGLREDSPNQTPRGWWGDQGTEIRNPHDCRSLDRRPGLTFIKYYHPVNESQPDWVGVVNGTVVDWNSPMLNRNSEQMAVAQQMQMQQNAATGIMLARLRGNLRPTLSILTGDKLQVCITHCNATLQLGDLPITHITFSPQQQRTCVTQSWPPSTLQQQSESVHAQQDSEKLDNADNGVTERERLDEEALLRREGGEDKTTASVPVDLKATKVVPIGGLSANNVAAYSGLLHHHQSKMELMYFKKNETPNIFTFDYLEPYTNGSCHLYRNCLHCLTDSLCGWCGHSATCVSRLEDESVTCSALTPHPPTSQQQQQLDSEQSIAGGELASWQYLTLVPAQCTNCSNYVGCEACAGSGMCEWWVEEARCSRVVVVGVAPSGAAGANSSSSDVAKVVEDCPTPCHLRSSCSSCLEQRGRCVWCSATRTCFTFAVYTSEYQFGQCREWLDQQQLGLLGGGEGSAADTAVVSQCQSCSMKLNCTSCLRSLGCGWCYNMSNPISGACIEGDFTHPSAPSNCSVILGSTTSPSKWAYAQCPDVDECGLGLDDCHPDAICTNTDGSYSCHCKRGYVGDGRTTCTRTCYNQCVHGTCSGPPEYECRCELGWTGEDCSVNCGCYGHSDCPEGVGICEKCHNFTEGADCSQCVRGSYGNATTSAGCSECQCNLHGEPAQGHCNMNTGVCYCRDHTEGAHCERCQGGHYYGDPRGGRPCFYQCEARGWLVGEDGGGIGSRRAYSAPWGGDGVTRECLWIIDGTGGKGKAVIQLQVNATDLNVTCGENAVYVYDGLPELVDMGSGSSHQNALTAVFCNEEAFPTTIVESKTGKLTVHYKQGLNGEGFSAMYTVLSCAAETTEVVVKRVEAEEDVDLVEVEDEDEDSSSEITTTTTSTTVSPNDDEPQSTTMTTLMLMESVAVNLTSESAGSDSELLTCPLPRVCANAHRQCLCPDGLTGATCGEDVCPRNCSAALGQGHCDVAYRRCVCNPRWAGPSCNIRITGSQLIFTPLFSTLHLTPPLDHLRKTLPRFGHSLAADHRRGSLWMFGGYSLSHGPLNDVRLFDTRNGTWLQVTVESNQDARMPRGRYFHGADIVDARQAVYVFGGMTGGGGAEKWWWGKRRLSVLEGAERVTFNRTLEDFWQFDIQNQRWNEIERHANATWPPPVAGHTMTYCKNTTSFIIVGGLSPQHGFVSVVWEYRLDIEKWEVWRTRGSGPTALFGHSTVFHAPSKLLYIFGGYELMGGKAILSNKLYTLSYDTHTWTDLSVFNPWLNSPKPRFLHSAVTTKNHMIIYGGRIFPWNVTDTLYAFSYSCNQWINLLSEGTDIVGHLPPRTHAQAITLLDPQPSNNENTFDSQLYIVGGWSSPAPGHSLTVLRAEMPGDLCALWPARRYCQRVPDCTYCALKAQDSTTPLQEMCYGQSVGSKCSLPDLIGREKLENPSRRCNGTSNQQLFVSGSSDCSSLHDCSSCVLATDCHWCSKAGGQCVSLTRLCSELEVVPVEGLDEDSEDGTIDDVSQCPYSECLAADCTQCQGLDEKCYWSWTKQYCAPVTKSTMPPPASNQIDQPSAKTSSSSSQQQDCPPPCSTFTSCSSCLDIDGCRWSTQLDECLSAAQQPLYCVGGVCGLVLQSEDSQYCPEPCASFRECSRCLRHAYCGWCALPGDSGRGVCTEGSSERPMLGACSDVFLHLDDPTLLLLDSTHSPSKLSPTTTLDMTANLVENVNLTWHYVTCPAENECENGHHTCAVDSERCVDLEEGFRCVCGGGYKSSVSSLTPSTAFAPPPTCEPVCTQGCVRGQCILPNVCQCDFGYVGANCSIQCQCNGHSNCAGPDKLDECLECHNNTMGAQCGVCQPLFVGDPSNGGGCVPCLEWCHNHTSICVPLTFGLTPSLTAAGVTTGLTAAAAAESGAAGETPSSPSTSNGTTTAPLVVEDMTLDELRGYLKEGAKGGARCIRCEGNTTGGRCDTCIPGYFRGSDDQRVTCRPCECNGHDDTCDPVNGDKCDCKNNTESDACPSSGSSKNSAQECWRVQCSKCREGFLGTPRHGHQCYKQMNMDSRMCFGARPIDECKLKPRPLLPGEMVFFVIQPRYMNVDIRAIIDVTQGKLNVFMSTHDDTYRVHRNGTTGAQEIDFDYNSKSTPTATQSKSGASSTPTNSILIARDASTSGLRTYITVRDTRTILAVRGLTDRLVITLPEEYHSLETTRFYLVLQSVLETPNVADSTNAYGIVFFTQDQLHIDLFVFFSVFFSCFFLFLAACVVAWKAKQAADVRRARRRHVVEMLHMAKRPFAAVTLNLVNKPPTSGQQQIVGCLAGPSANKLGCREPMQQQFYLYGHQMTALHWDLRPVALEPTEDGLAAVSTVFVSLPGSKSANGGNTGVRLALASSLILLAAAKLHLPHNGTTGGAAVAAAGGGTVAAGRAATFLRRRSAHGLHQGQQQPPT